MELKKKTPQSFFIQIEELEIFINNDNSAQNFKMKMRKAKDIYLNQETLYIKPIELFKSFYNEEILCININCKNYYITNNNNKSNFCKICQDYEIFSLINHFLKELNTTQHIYNSSKKIFKEKINYFCIDFRDEKIFLTKSTNIKNFNREVSNKLGNNLKKFKNNYHFCFICDEIGLYFIKKKNYLHFLLTKMIWIK